MTATGELSAAWCVTVQDERAGEFQLAVSTGCDGPDSWGVEDPTTFDAVLPPRGSCVTLRITSAGSILRCATQSS